MKRPSSLDVFAAIPSSPRLACLSNESISMPGLQLQIEGASSDGPKELSFASGVRAGYLESLCAGD
jgi:hypothetical protein